MRWMSSSYHLEQSNPLSSAALIPFPFPLRASHRPTSQSLPLSQHDTTLPLIPPSSHNRPWPPLRQSIVPYLPPQQLPPHQPSYPTLPFFNLLVSTISNSSPPSSVVPNTITSHQTTPLSPFAEGISSKSSPDSRPDGGMVFLERRGAGFPPITSTSFQMRKQISALQRWNYSSSGSQIYNLCPPTQ